MSDTKLADCQVWVTCPNLSETRPYGCVICDGYGGWTRPMSEADLDSLIRERGVTDEMVERGLRVWFGPYTDEQWDVEVSLVMADPRADRFRATLLAALSGEEG